MIVKLPSTDPSVYFYGRVEENGRNDDLLIIREIWAENVYEVLPSDFEDGVVVDIGAQIGVFSIWAAQKAKRVIAVEPESENFDLLNRNVKLNKLTNVDVSKFAIYSRSGSLRINHDMGNSSVIEHRANDELETVNAITLEDLFNQYGLEEVSTLKIDVEGAEPDILLAAPRHVLNGCRYITIEVDKKTGDRLGEMVQKLSETHKVTTLGSWERGGMIFARRY